MSEQYKAATALADHYIDQLSDWATVTRRPLFGASALYRGEHIFGMVWHGSLYFKVDEETRKDYEAANSQTLGHTAGEAADHSLKTYMEVPVDVIEDDGKLHQWAESAYQAALKSGH